MFWDGRIATQDENNLITPAGTISLDQIDNVVSAQALFPVTSADEMRGRPGDKDVFGQPNELAPMGDNVEAIWEALMARLLAIPSSADLFQAAYPDTALEELTFHDAANAIGAFEIAAYTFTDSPWDRYLAGDTSALSAEVMQGALLFYGEAGCARCHSGSLMTDQQYHNIGTPQFGPGKNEDGMDDGRFLETNTLSDQFAFRTPPLRNVAITAPYMHNGAYATLEAVIRHHLDAKEGLLHYDMSHLSPELQITCRGDVATQESILQTLDPWVAEPLALSDAEVGYLVAFLQALTAPSATNLAHTLPDEVPSGLPVRD
jgi:cytochrome c peroxidase